jgi:hypothetical protein
MDMSQAQRIYDNMTPPPDPESCGMCGKCWSHDEGYQLGGLVVCRRCWEKQKQQEDAE